MEFRNRCEARGRGLFRVAVCPQRVGITLNSTNVPSLQIICSPCATASGCPVASIYTSQPYPSVSFRTSSTTSTAPGFSATSAPHAGATSRRSSFMSSAISNRGLFRRAAATIPSPSGPAPAITTE